MNECEETNGGCEALCCNTIGSFYCRCPPGHVLTEDGRTCRGEYQNPLNGFVFVLWNISWYMFYASFAVILCSKYYYRVFVT